MVSSALKADVLPFVKDKTVVNAWDLGLLEAAIAKIQAST
jgi:hypothetical protein